MTVFPRGIGTETNIAYQEGWCPIKLSANCRWGRWALCGLGVLFWLGCATSEPPPVVYDMDHGIIKGARFSLLVPDDWSGQVLVIAHGSRPRKAPLVADLDPNDPLIRELLARGWLVATTSYRRNGRIFAAAQDDLLRLIDAIDRKYGPCRQIIVEGSSLGANLGLQLAEQQGRESRISGVVALGAALGPEVAYLPQDWTHVPLLPVLFVSNRPELAPVRDYVRAVRPDRLQPAVWLLERPGHVNINAAERLAAVAAIAQWADGGPRPQGTAARPLDVTVNLADRPSQAVPTRQGLRGHIAAVDPIYGNVDTDLVAADLAALQLQAGQSLRLVCGRVERRAQPGLSYGDVAAGKLVVFLNAEGFLRIAVNQGSAERKLKAHVGEPLEIRPWVEHVDHSRGQS